MRKLPHDEKWTGGLKRCFLCEGLIAEQRPVFLIQLASGGIVGPYHAGCAAKLADNYHRTPGMIEAQARGAKWYGHSRREETLPE